MPQINCLLVGAGAMAEAYAAVLKDIDVNVTVIGRGAASADRFREKTGLEVIEGGLEAGLEKSSSSDLKAIVATPVNALAGNCEHLLQAGVKEILVEKPAGLSAKDTRHLADQAKAFNASIYVAYNRRFHDSTQQAKTLIRQDGGPTSLRMEFSEFSHRIGELQTADEIKQAWLFANSTHVLDLGFYLAGHPVELSAKTKGALSWHHAGAQFVGHGETEHGAVFSYLADWEAAPRWSVEIGTRFRTITLQPLEQLKFREKTGFKETVFEIAPIDTQFKPGLRRQVAAFLEDNDDRRELCTIDSHANSMERVYTPILEGKQN